MGTESGRYGERKSRTENRGEGLSNTETDADWDKEMEKVKPAMHWRTCFSQPVAPDVTSMASKMGQRNGGVKEKAQGTF